MTDVPLDQVRQVDPAELERGLTELALAGAGWSELLVRVRTVTGRDCRLTDSDGAALATTDGGSGLDVATATSAAGSGGCFVVAEDGWRARAVPARIAGRLHAIALLAEPVGMQGLEVLDAMVTAVLIESVRQRAAVVDSGYQTGPAVIEALRGGVWNDAVKFGADRVGLDLSRRNRAAILVYAGARRRAWQTALTWLGRPVQVEEERAWLLVSDDDDLAEVCHQVQAAFGDDSNSSVRGASGSPVLFGEYAGSFREAERIVGTARDDAVLGFDDAGLMQTLLAVSPDRLRWFVDQHLGPLLERTELLTTLRIWLATNGSRRAASELLHLHRNSIGYRVAQLKALLGVDPLDPMNSAVLQTALAAYDLICADSTGAS